MSAYIWLDFDFRKECEKMFDLEENSKKLQELKKRLEQIGDSL